MHRRSNARQAPPSPLLSLSAQSRPPPLGVGWGQSPRHRQSDLDSQQDPPSRTRPLPHPFPRGPPWIGAGGETTSRPTGPYSRPGVPRKTRRQTAVPRRAPTTSDSSGKPYGPTAAPTRRVSPPHSPRVAGARPPGSGVLRGGSPELRPRPHLPPPHRVRAGPFGGGPPGGRRGSRRGAGMGTPGDGGVRHRRAPRRPLRVLRPDGRGVRVLNGTGGEGHGRPRHPPCRSSAWRRTCSTPSSPTHRPRIQSRRISYTSRPSGISTTPRARPSPSKTTQFYGSSSRERKRSAQIDPRASTRRDRYAGTSSGIDMRA